MFRYKSFKLPAFKYENTGVPKGKNLREIDQTAGKKAYTSIGNF